MSTRKQENLRGQLNAFTQEVTEEYRETGMLTAHNADHHGSKTGEQSKSEVAINVAIEGLEAGSWIEITTSVSGPQHVFSKMLTLTPLKAGASLALGFNPCETPIAMRNDGSSYISDHPCQKQLPLSTQANGIAAPGRCVHLKSRETGPECQVSGVFGWLSRHRRTRSISLVADAEG
jgi:hypothetical protein